MSQIRHQTGEREASQEGKEDQDRCRHDVLTAVYLRFAKQCHSSGRERV